MRESEHLRKLADYAKRNLKKGYDKDSLTWALINQGNSKTMVLKALEIANQEIAREMSQEKPVITHEIVDENNMSVTEEKPWWKRFFGL